MLINALCSRFNKKKTIMGDRSKPVPPRFKIILKGAKIGSVTLYINCTIGLE
jgi:hypothetical protein